MDDALQFRQLGSGDAPALAVFFATLTADGDDRYFHPHRFNDEEARMIARYPGRDLYCGALAGSHLLAYGLLRGWDAGFNVPSLGIAVGREARGTGLARAFMLYLHAAARHRGVPRIRLKVYPDNLPARRLYESLGYTFAETTSDGQFVGVLTFAPDVKAA